MVEIRNLPIAYSQYKNLKINLRKYHKSPIDTFGIG